MALLQFLLKNWDSVVLILAVVGVVIYLIKTGQTKILKKIAIRLVTEAEGELGDGTGIFKQAAVIEEVKKKWAENANIQTYIESKQLMKLTALSVGFEEMEIPDMLNLEPGTIRTK